MKTKKRKRRKIMIKHLTVLMAQTKMVRNVKRRRPRSMLHSSTRRHLMRMEKRRTPTLTDALSEEEQTKENIAYSNSRSIISHYIY